RGCWAFGGRGRRGQADGGLRTPQTQVMSGAMIIDGKQVAAGIRAAVKADVERFTATHGEPPGLATVLVGDDHASQVYVAGKHKACAEVGINSLGHELPASATAKEVRDLLADLNRSPQVDGILLQLPLPDHL